MATGLLAHDPAALAAMPAVAEFIAPAQADIELDRSSVDFQPAANDNVDYPDCTVASLTECARGTAALQGWQLNVAAGAPLAFFANCVGIQLGNDAALRACPGARLADIAAAQCALGYDIGPQRISGAVATIPLNRHALGTRMKLAPLWVGALLTQSESSGPTTWSLEAARGDARDGHAFMLWDYAGLADSDFVRISTWGMWYRATWGWIMARLQEAHLLWLPQIEDGPAVKEMAQVSSAWATSHLQSLPGAVAAR
jgi:hypothetical protein